MEKKWFEELKNQCPVCRQYGAVELVKEARKFRYFKCKLCGFTRKHEIAFAQYKHENGKVYLKSNKLKNFTEVELRNFDKFLKVVPVSNKKLF